MKGLSEGVFLILAGLIAGVIVLFAILRARKKDNLKPINRNVKAGSKDNETDVRSIIRQELQHMNGAETETQTVVKEEKPPELVESWSKDGEVNAEIVNPVSRTIGFYHVNLLPNKDYGRQWLIQAKNIYSLRIGIDGKLEKMPHNTSMTHPTSEVYEALQTKEDIKEVFGNHDEGENKLKIGMLVLAACVALFLMFMAIYKGKA